MSGMNGKLQFFRSVMWLRMFTVGLVGKLLTESKCLARVLLGGSILPNIKSVSGVDLVVVI